MVNDPERPAYLDRLPIGERLPLGELTGDPLFPFDGDLAVQPLAAPVIPEPVRRGAPGGEPCPTCTAPEAGTIWSNERWLVRADPDEPHGLPMVALLLPRAHHDLLDLPPNLTAELGPMIQRVAAAISALPEVGRVHVNRWGDGSEHFHVWFLARPLGMWQMRGAMLAVWDDLLPPVPAGEWRANTARVAALLGAEDGEAR